MSAIISLKPFEQASPKVLLRNLFIWVLTVILFFDGLNVFSLIPIGATVLNGIKLFSFALLILYVIANRHNIQRNDFLLCLAYIPMFWIYAGEDNPVTAGLKVISRFVPIFSFLLIDADSKKKIFYTWVKLYVYTLVPAIIIHILKLGFSIQFPVIAVNNILGEVYDSHFLMYFYNRWNYIRFCGLYDEPGVVGTFSFFLIGFFSHQLTRFQKIVLWTSGLFALSFFFIGTIPFLIASRLLLNRKYLTLTFSGIALVVFVAMLPLIISLAMRANNKSAVYEDIVMHTIKTRLNVNQDDFSVTSIKTNRLNSKNYTFDNFKRASLGTQLFGNFVNMGSKEFGKLTKGGLGIEIYLYQHGLLLLMYTFVLIFFLLKMPAQLGFFRSMMALIMILLCIYTRTYLFRLEFMVLIYMGIIALNHFRLPHTSEKKLISF